MIFKASNGNWFLRQLFYETTMADKTNVIYTLKEHPHLNYPSLYQAYLTTADPTEYSFVQNYLGGWSHWEDLTSCSWFKPYIMAWRRELDVKIKAKALSHLFAAADGPDVKISIPVNKYLLEKDWTPQGQKKRGAPSKDEIKSAARELAVMDSQIEADFERLKVN